MHIPDNFLSPPVWATLDAVAIPAVGFMVRQAGRELDDARIPLLGVMGAFVFAAQMINFPGGHRDQRPSGGRSVAGVHAGPGAGRLVMTAIIAIQAFVFQDGGVLALGANVFNMAIVGVLAGYWPFHVWGAQAAAAGDFRGSLLVGAGQRVAGAGRIVDFGRRDAAADGSGFAGPVCGQRGDRRRHHGCRDTGHGETGSQVRSSGRRLPTGALWPFSVDSAIALGGVGFLVASAAPDGIQRLGIQMGLTRQDRLACAARGLHVWIFRRIGLDQKSHGRAWRGCC